MSTTEPGRPRQAARAPSTQRLCCVVITGTGFSSDERAWLQRLCERLPGAVYDGVLNCNSTTHLVCRSVLNAVGTPKYNAALAWGVQVVSWKWAVDSTAAGRPLPVAPYKTDPPHDDPFPAVPAAAKPAAASAAPAKGHAQPLTATTPPHKPKPASPPDFSFPVPRWPPSAAGPLHPTAAVQSSHSPHLTWQLHGGTPAAQLTAAGPPPVMEVDDEEDEESLVVLGTQPMDDEEGDEEEAEGAVEPQGVRVQAPAALPGHLPTPSTCGLTAVSPGTVDVATPTEAELDAMLVSPAGGRQGSGSPAAWRPFWRQQGAVTAATAAAPAVNLPRMQALTLADSRADCQVADSDGNADAPCDSPPLASWADMEASPLEAQRPGIRSAGTSSDGAPSVLYSGFGSQLGVAGVQSVPSSENDATQRSGGSSIGSSAAAGASAQLPLSDSLVTKRRPRGGVALPASGFTPTSDPLPSCLSVAAIERATQDGGEGGGTPTPTVGSPVDDPLGRIELSLADGLGLGCGAGSASRREEEEEDEEWRHPAAEPPQGCSDVSSVPPPQPTPPSTTSSGPSQHLISRAGVTLVQGGLGAARQVAGALPPRPHAKLPSAPPSSAVAVKPEPGSDAGCGPVGVIASPTDDQPPSLAGNHRDKPHSLLGPALAGLVAADEAAGYGGDADAPASALPGLHHLPQPCPADSDSDPGAPTVLLRRVKREPGLAEGTGIVTLRAAQGTARSSARPPSALARGPPVLRVLSDVLLPALLAARGPEAAARGFCFVQPVKRLSRPPRTSTAREAHPGLRSLTDLKFAEQVLLQAPGLPPLHLLGRDKAKRIAAAVVKPSQSPGAGAPPWAIAEPMTFYCLPDGRWFMEFHQLWPLDAACTRAAAAGAAPLEPPSSFQPQRELLRDECRQHCSVTDVICLVGVCRSRRGLSKPPRAALPGASDLEGLGAVELMGLAQSVFELHQLHGFDSSTGRLLAAEEGGESASASGAGGAATADKAS